MSNERIDLESAPACAEPQSESVKRDENEKRYSEKQVNRIVEAMLTLERERQRLKQSQREAPKPSTAELLEYLRHEKRSVELEGGNAWIHTDRLPGLIAALERLQITESHIDQAIRFLEQGHANNALLSLKGAKP